MDKYSSLAKHIFPSNIEAIDQDASMRKYTRLYIKDTSYIYMDSDKEPESLKNFIKIGRYLYNQGYRVPDIFVKSGNHLIIEDLGRLSLKKFIEANSEEDIEKIYRKILDKLISIQRLPNSLKLDEYNIVKLVRELNIFINWVAKDIAGFCREDFMLSWWDFISCLKQLPNSIIMRDMVVDNIMICDDNRIGLLDFQDAVWGTPILDVVSLLQDARYDMPIEMERRLFSYYVKSSRLDERICLQHKLIVSTHRLLRILGVFVRQKSEFNNDKYIRYIPRVLSCIKNNIRYMPELRDVVPSFIFDKIY